MLNEMLSNLQKKYSGCPQSYYYNCVLQVIAFLSILLKNKYNKSDIYI